MLKQKLTVFSPPRLYVNLLLTLGLFSVFLFMGSGQPGDNLLQRRGCARECTSRVPWGHTVETVTSAARL